VPDGQWKQDNIGEPWTLGDTYNYGIGQGYVAATPLQMLDEAAAIANGGNLLVPHLVSHFQDSAGNQLDPVKTDSRGELPVSSANLDIMRAAMRQSVTTGVARNAAANSVEVAGKTGTAEFGEQHDDGKYDTHGWFIGFAPYNDPEIAVMVFVENGSGGNDASPAASKIFDYYFGHATSGPQQTSQPQNTFQPQDTGAPEPTLAPIPTPNPQVTAAAAPIVPDTPTPTPEPTAIPEPTDTPAPPTETPADTPTPAAPAAAAIARAPP